MHRAWHDKPIDRMGPILPRVLAKLGWKWCVWLKNTIAGSGPLKQQTPFLCRHRDASPRSPAKDVTGDEMTSFCIGTDRSLLGADRQLFQRRRGNGSACDDDAHYNLIEALVLGADHYLDGPSVLLVMLIRLLQTVYCCYLHIKIICGHLCTETNVQSSNRLPLVGSLSRHCFCIDLMTDNRG